MVIYKVKSRIHKKNQQVKMVVDCIYNWQRLNNARVSRYHDVMNMESHRYNDQDQCYFALTYHFNPNKW